MFDGRLLKVVCESPGKLAGPVRVVLTDRQSGREWKQRLGDSRRFRPFPAIDWLSPLHRRQTSFRLVDAESNHPGSHWLVPASALTRSQLRIEPAIAEGCANVAYSFEVADLRQWVVPARTR